MPINDSIDDTFRWRKELSFSMGWSVYFLTTGVLLSHFRIMPGHCVRLFLTTGPLPAKYDKAFLCQLLLALL